MLYRTVEIPTTLDHFAYWLARDWPRYKRLHLLTLTEIDATPYERQWAAGAVFPWLAIYALQTVPSQITVSWWRATSGLLLDIVDDDGLIDDETIAEMIAGWAAFRFGAIAREATIQPEEEPPAVLDLPGPGRPRYECNRRAIERLLSEEERATVRADWVAEYTEEAGIAPEDPDFDEARTWYKRVWKPYLEALGGIKDRKGP